MQARVITIKGNHLSETGAGVLRESSALFENEFDIKTFDAITADESNKLFTREGLRWTYPWEGQQSDIATGLKLSAYSGADPRKRVACFMSHYRLWKEAAKSSENYLILEHDAYLEKKIDAVVYNPHVDVSIFGQHAMEAVMVTPSFFCVSLTPSLTLSYTL